MEKLLVDFSTNPEDVDPEDLLWGRSRDAEGEGDETRKPPVCW